MPRRDEYEDDRPRKRKPNTATPLWVIAVILGSVVVVCGGGTAFVFFALLRPGPDDRTPAAKAAVEGAGKKVKDAVYSREEFKALTMGKTQAEVVEIMGRPDSAHDQTADGKTSSWTYYYKTINPATGKADFGRLDFKDGVVVRVGW